MVWQRFRKLVVSLLCIFICLTGCGNKEYSSITVENKDAIVDGIRQTMVNRTYSTVITINAHTDDEDSIITEIDGLMADVFEDNENPNQGDYLRYQCGGYEIKSSTSFERNKYTYKIRVIPTYYTTAEEEMAVDEMVADVIISMNLPDAATDYEKVRAVNDFVCYTVDYDTVHKHTPGSNHIQSTAYGALKYHTALCQGYAVLCYRLLKELNVDVRVVTGDLDIDGVREKHAWNIVCIDGKYYNLDVTLNDVNATDDYLLMGSDDFYKDHFIADEFATEEFETHYKISKENYLK